MDFKFAFPRLFFSTFALLVVLNPKCADAVLNTEVDVLILGGGMAGITAANYLHNNGITNFLVLEAQDYVGGRLKNLSFGGLTLGEGANWIQYVEEGSENPILELVEKLKLTRYANDYYDVEVKNSAAGNADFNKTMKALNDAAAKVANDNENMSRQEDQPLRSALAEKGWRADTALKSAIEWVLLDFEYAVKTQLISTRHYSGLPEENSFVTDPRGFATILDYLANGFTDRIQTGKVATEIKYGSDGVEVKTGDGHTYKANYTLCTFSTGVLGADLVKFVPELPSWKREAVSRIPLAYYTHIFVKFPNAFWEDKEFLINAEKVRGEYPLLYNLNKENFHTASNVLLFTAVDDDSLRVESQHENATINEVLEVLKGMYPKANISYPTDIFVSKWSNNPYVQGSYSNAVVGSTLADFHNLEGRLNNLFFAGEACDEEYWGFLQGAYFTGLRQAKAIDNCINGNECEAYKPEKADGCPKSSAMHSGRNVDLFLLSIFLVMLSIYD